MENLLKYLFLSFSLLPCCLFGKGEKGVVVKGKATFEEKGNTQTLRTENKTIIHFDTFHLKPNETTRFIQPNEKSSVLCRITGKESSIIGGRLESNGSLFLINPQGMIFTETAQIYVGSLIASTLDLQNEDFIKGTYRFSLSPEAQDKSIINKGAIHAQKHALLIASQIHDEGSLTAPTIGLIGCEVILLTFDEDRLISFAIEVPLQQGMIETQGTLSGNELFLQLATAQKLRNSVINTEGLTEAGAMEETGGTTKLIVTGSIAANKIHLEGDTIISKAIFTGLPDLEIWAHKELEFVQNNSPLHSLQQKGAALVHLGGNLTAFGNISFEGGVNFSKKEQRASSSIVSNRGNLRFSSYLTGNNHLSLEAPEGTILLKGPMGSASKNEPKFQSIHLKGESVDQRDDLYAAGPIIYEGKKIYLGGSIKTTNHSITFEGPVMITSPSVSIKSGLSRGNIYFNSTLDADQPTRKLTLDNGTSKGEIHFKNDIGLNGALQQLTITTSKLILHNVGDKNKGVIQHLNIRGKQGIECYGNRYLAGQQTWNSWNISLKGEGEVFFFTDLFPLSFEKTHALNLGTTSCFTLSSEESSLQLPNLLLGQHQQSIYLCAEKEKIELGEISGKIGSLHVKAPSIALEGKVEAHDIWMESGFSLLYKEKTGLIPTANLISPRSISLNAKRGSVGSEDYPIQINTEGELYVGAKLSAYLKGECLQENLHSHSFNPPFRIFFNGQEIQNAPSLYLSDEEPVTLIPDLVHSSPVHFLKKNALKRRRAHLYYHPLTQQIGLEQTSGRTKERSSFSVKER